VAIVIAAVVVGGKAPTSAPLVPDLVHAQGNYKYTGAASCASSSCHGSTKPKADYPKLNENIVWRTKDAHHKAFATLTNEQLKSKVSPSGIAKKLKIDKAETSSRCLVCHSVDVKPELRGEKFKLEDGVSCEGCHGPAEKWLDPHAEKGWTHEKSVAVGMYDTKSFLLRAEKCVSCHLHIEADMVEAGHPDLQAFELDGFSDKMPPHWRDKGPFASTKAWATGQVISLREAAKQLAERAEKGSSPAAVKDALQKVQGHGAVVKILFNNIGPDVAKSVDADVAGLTDAVGKGDKGKIGSTAKNLASTMNAQAPKVAGREFDAASTKKLLTDLAGSGDALGSTGMRAAEQGAMAMDRLYAAHAKSAGGENKASGAALDKMFDSLGDDPSKFDAKAFSAATKSFADTIK
jgi:cytochrome c554/c'-like protein